MKKAKRVQACLLAMMLLLNLSACGGRDAVENTTELPAQTTQAPETEAPTAEIQETQETQMETTAAAEEAESAVLGKTENYIYTNTYLGIGMQVDPTWAVATPVELAQLVGITADAITDEDMAQALRESGVVYDLYAMSSDGLKTLNVVLENLGVVYGTILSEEAYIALSQSQLSAGLESAGLTNITTETITVHFAGADHAGIYVHGQLSGIDFYETLVCVKEGNYMAIAVAGSYYEDTSAETLSQFYALGS